jgi:hypothetical protein
MDLTVRIIGLGQIEALVPRVRAGQVTGPPARSVGCHRGSPTQNATVAAWHPCRVRTLGGADSGRKVRRESQKWPVSSPRSSWISSGRVTTRVTSSESQSTSTITGITYRTHRRVAICGPHLFVTSKAGHRNLTGRLQQKPLSRAPLTAVTALLPVSGVFRLLSNLHQCGARTTEGWLRGPCATCGPGFRPGWHARPRRRQKRRGHCSQPAAVTRDWLGRTPPRQPVCRRRPSPVDDGQAGPARSSTDSWQRPIVRGPR